MIVLQSVELPMRWMAPLLDEFEIGHSEVTRHSYVKI